jgi:hypothetical protein
MGASWTVFLSPSDVDSSTICVKNKKELKVHQVKGALE